MVAEESNKNKEILGVSKFTIRELRDGEKRKERKERKVELVPAQPRLMQITA